MSAVLNAETFPKSSTPFTIRSTLREEYRPAQTLPILEKRSPASWRPPSESALRPAVVCSKPRPAVPVNSVAATISPVSVRTARAETFATAE